jgi:hypothetical protein
VTFEDDAGAYDQRDAAGFIKLNAWAAAAAVGRPATGPRMTKSGFQD